MKKIIPVLLAGGSGKRLWPLSRGAYPKQFSKLINSESLFQLACRRVSCSKTLKFSDLIVITHYDFRYLVSEQLRQLGMKAKKIILEPEGKNTGPAVLVSTLLSLKIDEDAIILVIPSDHIIPNTQSFHEAIEKGLKDLDKKLMVTFGITPNYPETGYGYLKVLESKKSESTLLEEFIEKPTLKRAKCMIKDKNYLWNSGVFLFRAEDMYEAFLVHCNNLIEPVKNSIKNNKNKSGFFTLNRKYWLECDDVSLDYSIMEKAKNLSVVQYNGAWSDLGSWNAIWKNYDKDNKGVVVSLNSDAVDCKDTLLLSEDETVP